jgi:hypothetical protein
LHRFDNWPQSALRSVAKRFIVAKDLMEFAPRLDKDGEILRKGLTEMCVDVHTSVIASAEVFLKKLGRRVYVARAKKTPECVLTPNPSLAGTRRPSRTWT